MAFEEQKRQEEKDKKEQEALRAEDAECIVCFSEFSCGDACRKLPCGHFFHTECIDQWLAPPNGRARTSCPVCSQPLTGGFAVFNAAE